MARDLHPEDLRDQQIVNLTDRHARTRMAMLRAGDPVVINAVSQSVSAVITAKDMDMLVRLCVKDDGPCGAWLACIVNKVVRDEAEIDAIKDVEVMEKQREQETAEDTISTAMYGPGRPVFASQAGRDIQLAQERAERSPLVRMVMGRA